MAYLGGHVPTVRRAPANQACSGPTPTRQAVRPARDGVQPESDTRDRYRALELDCRCAEEFGAGLLALSFCALRFFPLLDDFAAENHLSVCLTPPMLYALR
jgi:hypothetical protein